MSGKAKTRVLILGAAGRDFHDFNVYWKHREDCEVVGFSATQIPNIAGRAYPPELSGERYPEGIPIFPEDDLEQWIERYEVDEAALAYSDLSYVAVMRLAARVQAAGASFHLLGPRRTMVPGTKPIIAVCAVRTGCGKSQTTRYIAGILREAGRSVAVVRHPMPYGDLRLQICQRFATLEDMDRADCTIEEREEYEPHVDAGVVVFAGVDYEKILREAEKEAEVILWDGGNNDLPFYRPDLHIVVVDPHRPGHETGYYPGETNLRMADMVLLNKVATAELSAVERLEADVRRVNPRASVFRAASPIDVSDPAAIAGKKVLVIEDGPTLTHGEMSYGAGHVAARQHGAAEIVDPRPWAVGSLVETFKKYGHLDQVLPAMGYGAKQVGELEETIRRVPCDLVLVATPIDLTRLLEIDKPAQRVRYSLAPHDPAGFEQAILSVVGRGQPT